MMRSSTRFGFTHDRPIMAAHPVIFAGVLGVCTTALADIINVPADQPTIQAAINVAVNGDEIVVAPGTYFETIDFLGKAISVRSSDGPEVTTIDANAAGTVVLCVTGEGPDTVLDGFTITGGNGGLGGGMFNIGSSPTVTNCTFSGNTAAAGGGMFNLINSPTVTNCTFSGNTASGGSGGGMFNLSSSPTVTNCTFSGNTASTGGGGMLNESDSSPTVTNCILWGNTPDEFVNASASFPTVSFSDVQGGLPAGTNDGGGNIDADPLFVFAAGGDLRLAPFSPCIDAANNTAVPPDVLDLDGDGDTAEPIPFDLDGNPRFVDDPGTADTGLGDPPIVDMGAYEFQATTPDPVNFVELIGLRADDFLDPADEFFALIAVEIPTVTLVSSVSVLTGGELFIPLEDPGDGRWTEEVHFPDLAGMQAAFDGLWTLTITGESSSTSTFTFDAGTLSESDFFATPTGVFPPNGETNVPIDVIFSWADPTGVETADGLFVFVEPEDELDGDQEDDSILGSLDITDTSWDPPLNLEPGFHEFGVAYANFDDAALVSPLMVTSGSISWGNSPFAPEGYPASTPLLFRGSLTIVGFEVVAGPIGFEDPDELPAAGEPTAEASGDLDSDGDTDLVVVIPVPAGGLLPNGSVQVFLNQGTDEFGEWLGFVSNDPIPVGLEPSSVAVGFFDADTHLDLAVTNAGDNTVVVLLNDGSGMGTFIVQAPIAVGNRPSSVIAGDFNEDTFTDLAVANTFLTAAGEGGVADNSVLILFNDGKGGFMEGLVLDTGGTDPGALVRQDLDNDKCLDLMGVNKSGAPIPLGDLVGNVFVLLNQGGGVFAPAATYDVGVLPADLSVGDLDLDGFADIVAVNEADATASILINVGDGTFGPASALPVGGSPRSVVAVDLDGDSDRDLAIVADDPVIGPAVQVFENLLVGPGAASGEGLAFSEPMAFSVGADPNFVVSVDLDGDGLPDLVTVNGDIDEPSGGSVTGLINNPLPVELLANLDIKPGSCPNSYNRNSHGVLPVALVGRESFDVTQVDLATILLSRADGVGGSVTPHEGPPGPHSTIEDVATPFDGQPCDCHELEGDGIDDLMMHFKTVDVVAALELNNLPDGDLVSLTLIGNLLDGTPFEADDCVRLVPPGTSDGLLAVGSNLPGVWLDVSPLDLQLDGGGFANFERTFPQTTVVTLTAQQMHDGWRFVGWSIGLAGSTQDGGLHSGSSIELTIQDHLQQIEAIYRPAVLDTLHEH